MFNSADLNDLSFRQRMAVQTMLQEAYELGRQSRIGEMPALPPLPETEWELYIPAMPHSPGWVCHQSGYEDGDVEEYAKQYAQLCIGSFGPSE